MREAKPDPARMAFAYLALWKLVDVQFPDHNWLEILPESQEELETELRDLLTTKLEWAEDPAGLRDEIQRTLAFVRVNKIKDPDWRKEAEALRKYYQERALKYTDDIQMTLGASNL